MSKLRDRKHRHDKFFRLAQSENYVSRAVYKLQEIDKRFGLIKKGDKVLDLGCRPGSWLQYAAKKVGAKGRVVGIDLKAVDLKLPANVQVLVGDAGETAAEKLMEFSEGFFDVVISDMAPNTTGIRSADVSRSLRLLETVVEISNKVLRTGGCITAKVFQGSCFDEGLYEVKRHFKKVKNVRPEGTRKSSMEIYVVGMEKRETPLPKKK